MINDILDIMEQDFESTIANPLEKTNNTALATVSKLARAISAKSAEVQSLDEQLKAAKKRVVKANGRRPACLYDRDGSCVIYLGRRF